MESSFTNSGLSSNGLSRSLLAYKENAEREMVKQTGGGIGLAKMRLMDYQQMDERISSVDITDRENTAHNIQIAFNKLLVSFKSAQGLDITKVAGELEAFFEKLDKKYEDINDVLIYDLVFKTRLALTKMPSIKTLEKKCTDLKVALEASLKKDLAGLTNEEVKQIAAEDDRLKKLEGMIKRLKEIKEDRKKFFASHADELDRIIAIFTSDKDLLKQEVAEAVRDAERISNVITLNSIESFAKYYVKTKRQFPTSKMAKNTSESIRKYEYSSFAVKLCKPRVEGSLLGFDKDYDSMSMPNRKGVVSGGYDQITDLCYFFDNTLDNIRNSIRNSINIKISPKNVVEQAEVEKPLVPLAKQQVDKKSKAGSVSQSIRESFKKLLDRLNTAQGLDITKVAGELEALFEKFDQEYEDANDVLIYALVYKKLEVKIPSIKQLNKISANAKGTLEASLKKDLAGLKNEEVKQIAAEDDRLKKLEGMIKRLKELKEGRKKFLASHADELDRIIAIFTSGKELSKFTYEELSTISKDIRVFEKSMCLELKSAIGKYYLRNNRFIDNVKLDSIVNKIGSYRDGCAGSAKDVWTAIKVFFMVNGQFIIEAISEAKLAKAVKR